MAYFVLLVLVGEPLYFMEFALGQFSGVSAMRVWRCFPLAQGVGVAMIIHTVLMAIYYNVFITYTAFYFVQSFHSELPWSECRAQWGADDKCYVRGPEQNCSFVNDTSTCRNGSSTPSEQFWEKYVLQITSGIHEIGALKWDLTVTLLFCWIIHYFALMKGIRLSGKIVYFTATAPYLILLVFAIYGSTLQGATEGIRYFFIPNWRMLLNITVWRSAAEQLIFSLSIGVGSLIAYSSYNRFDNFKLLRDATYVSFLDFLASLLAGVAVFSMLGNMSYEENIDISKVAKEDHGLAFVIFPEALVHLPIPQLWTALFFAMLFLIAIDSEFSMLENFFTFVFDEFPNLWKRKSPITFCFCMLFFVISLPCVTQGGHYIVNLMDRFGGGLAGSIIAACQTAAIMWGYGAEKLSDDIDFMLGFRPGLYMRICWKYVSPIVLIFAAGYGFFQRELMTYRNMQYPLWAQVLAWCLMLVSVIHIPIWALIHLYTCRKDIRRALLPDFEWGPIDSEARRSYQISKLEFQDLPNSSSSENMSQEDVTAHAPQVTSSQQVEHT